MFVFKNFTIIKGALAIATKHNIGNMWIIITSSHSSVDKNDMFNIPFPITHK